MSAFTIALTYIPFQGKTYCMYKKGWAYGNQLLSKTGWAFFNNQILSNLVCYTGNNVADENKQP